MPDNMIFQEDSPIARFRDNILEKAVLPHASDIHSETFDDKFAIRYRVDGELITLEDTIQEIAKPVFSRPKILANLKISETRLPQHGDIVRMIKGDEIESRISRLSTHFGKRLYYMY
jgi:type II secretory ATPase GspE/PulE/Tfp pilus assembly ATPase PilB-like protein